MELNKIKRIQFNKTEGNGIDLSRISDERIKLIQAAILQADGKNGIYGDQKRQLD